MDFKEMSQEELVSLAQVQYKKIEQLERALEEKHDELITLQVSLAAEELRRNQTQQLPVIPAEPVEFEGKRYKFKLPVFWINGKKYTAEQAAYDLEIVKEILAIPGQNILKHLK